MKKLIGLLAFIAWMSAGGALPAFAQGIIAPGHAIGNGSSGTRTPTDYPILSILAQGTLGTSVNNPGTGTLESLLPPHTPTLTGNAYTMAQADLFKETRFANGGTNFTVTLPPSTTTGLTNGSRIVTNNIDSTATMTVAAGAGTQVNGGSSVSVGPTRSVAWIYDTTGGTPTWRSTYNGVQAVLSGQLGTNVLAALENPANVAGGFATYVLGTNSTFGLVEGDGTTITCISGVCTAIGSSATSIDAGGLTSITGSPPALGLLYNNSGKVGASNALPNGTTATTQAQGDASTKVMTDAFGVENDPGGFLNLLRNASLSAWFHGSSGTATTTAANTNWTAEGVFVIPTGASVTWSRQTLCVQGPNYYCLQVTGASSVTDIKIRFVVESFSWLKATGQTVTFQFKWTNNSGSSITPTLATAYPTTQDGGVTSGAGWSADTADLSATNLQACPNSSTCTEAYTLTTSGSANTGYEFIVDFGNNFGSSGDTFELLGFDARVTPGVATGTNSSPPTPEIRDPKEDISWNQRFYDTSYNNGTSPGTSTHTGITMCGTAPDDNTDGHGFAFHVEMRSIPSVTYWDGAGNNSISFFSSGNWIDNATNHTGGASPNSIAVGTRNAVFSAALGSGGPNANEFFVHYAADASIWGK